MPVPLRPNDRWSMDFVADTFGASRRLRILAINDDCCRENLCLGGDTSISGVQGRPRTRHAGAALRQASLHRQRQRPRSGSSGGKRPADLVAPIAISADVVLIQMASIVKESALGHSKHRIQRPRRSWSSPSLK